MLRNLWKHEIKDQGRTMCGLYAFIAISTTLVILFKLFAQYFDGTLATNIYAVVFAMYVMTMVCVFVSGFIYLCVHFYQTMYSAQGYLTHTLPVSTTQILNAKVIVSAAYLFLTGIAAIISLAAVSVVENEISLKELMHVVTAAFGNTEISVPGAWIILFLFLAMALGCLDALLLFFAGSSIGQLAKRSRGACGVAAGVGLYYATQIVSLLIVVAAAFAFSRFFDPVSGMHDAALMIRLVMCGIILMTLLYGAVYYAISLVIVKKHLNLE